MSNIFSGAEVVEIGIQIEKNGRDFYNALVQKSKELKSKGIFEYLAKEEERHIKAFQGILDKLQNYEPPQTYAGEYVAYMNALAGEYVFTQKDKGEEMASRVKSDREAINLGMGFEKDSIVFYEGIKKVVPEYELKVINELITQEQEHLRKLLELKGKI